MSIATHYRGKVSFSELLDMPIDYIHTLEYLAYKHKDDQQVKNQQEAEALEDEMEAIN